MPGAINYFSPVFLFLPVIFASLLTGTATRPNGMEVGNHKWLQEVHWDVFVTEGLNLHSPGVMGSFPSCANATGEWGLCCQASLQCVAIRARDWTLIICLRNTFVFQGTGRKHSWFQTLPKLCIPLMKLRLLSVLYGSTHLWLNDTVLKTYLV